jgi:hypothetical protein
MLAGVGSMRCNGCAAHPDENSASASAPRPPKDLNNYDLPVAAVHALPNMPCSLQMVVVVLLLLLLWHLLLL